MLKIKKYLKTTFAYSRYVVLRNWVDHIHIILQKRKLIKIIPEYYSDNQDEQIQDVINFIKNHGMQMIPYEFTKKYNPENISVYLDTSSGYPYVLVENKSIFFPRSLSTKSIQSAVSTALMEQDEKSPHRYLSKEISVDKDDICALIGASDGIMALSIIDLVKKVYLFEADSEWIKPLQLTFEKYQNKIEIVKKYVSDITTDTEITLDSFFESKGESVNFIQADIEGSEKKMLLGAKNILSKKNVKLSICLYHHHCDEKVISETLKSNGFALFYSIGYMIMWMQHKLPAPYLRKGIVYARK